MNPITLLIFKEIETTLHRMYESNEARIMYNMLLENFPDVDDHKATRILEDIKLYRPIQYIIGKSYFWDMELKVAEGVLIPRPETDELLYNIKKNLQSNGIEIKNILDIGTGSGCIALALKKIFPHANVSATDISNLALSIAKENSESLGLEIEWIQHDILANEALLEEIKFDIIVSNPPYILPSEADTIEPHVKEFEPANALYVSNDDPLQFYKAIESFAKNRLNERGNLFFELHSRFAEETKTYMERLGWNTRLSLDMQYKPRILHCYKN